MMEKTKNIRYKTVEIMLTMFGAIAGVGFVTGVEIEDFFARFGTSFVFGIIILFLLMLLLVYKILPCENNLSINVKKQKFMINTLKNTSLRKNKIKNFILFFNLLMISSAMFSGLRILLFDILKNNYQIFYLLSILVVFVLLICGISGLAKFNYFVIVFLFFIMIFVLKNISTSITLECNDFNLKNSAGAMLFASIYVFMNIVELEPIVREYNVSFSNRKRFMFALIFSLTVSMFVCVMCLFLRKNRLFAQCDMPLLMFFGEMGKGFKFVFCVGLVFALLSTLLTCLVGVKRNVITALGKIGNLSSSFIALILSVIIGILPFSFFTKLIYPIIGVFNFIIFVFL